MDGLAHPQSTIASAILNQGLPNNMGKASLLKNFEDMKGNYIFFPSGVDSRIINHS